MSEVSERLMNAIKEKGISYGELSKLTGIPKSVLQRYATGYTNKIPVVKLKIIARALNVEISDLLDFQQKETQELEQQNRLYPELEGTVKDILLEHHNILKNDTVRIIDVEIGTDESGKKLFIDWALVKIRGRDWRSTCWYQIVLIDQYEYRYLIIPVKMYSPMLCEIFEKKIIIHPE